MTTFNREDSIDLPILDEAPEAPEAGRKKLYIGDDGVFRSIDSNGDVVAHATHPDGEDLITPLFVTIPIATPSKVVLDEAFTLKANRDPAPFAMMMLSTTNNTMYFLMYRTLPGPAWAGWNLSTGAYVLYV
ncbi:MAG: hypothetical protein KC441_01560 [Anaerolineales bacterium]|nr:hypothetical protein [Anaerolineales bacterium]